MTKTRQPAATLAIGERTIGERTDDELVNLPLDELDPIERWLLSGLRDLTLPSGTRVKVQAPDWAEVIVDGTIDRDLLAALVAAEKKEPADRTLDDARAGHRSRRIRAAMSVRYVHDGRRFIRHALDEAAFTRLPTADRDALIEALDEPAPVATPKEADGG